MHIYFSGIGGTGIGPLSLVAKQAGYEVSGSDKQDSSYISNLKQNGITDIHIGQDYAAIAAAHKKSPIDWYVYSSAIAIEQPDAPELVFCREHGIKMTKRDDFINHILQEKQLRLLAVAGTHGKTTTTAMLIWLLQKLDIPVSYSVGAKLSFGPMGRYQEGSEYFVYEADEFDRNFLAFQPFMSIITGLDWDHPDIYPTRESYNEAFQQFAHQSQHIIAWQRDIASSKIEATVSLQETDPLLNKLTIAGEVNRLDAAAVITAVSQLTGIAPATLVPHMNTFPGLSRRFEEIIPGLYSDYAHTPPKIRGALQLAHEVAGDHVVVVYEGLHNTRQHFIKDELLHLFDGLEKLYIVPSYLAREDTSLAMLTPEDLRGLLSVEAQAYTTATELNESLKHAITDHLNNGKLVLCLSAGGGNSLDTWIRKAFTEAS